MLRLGLPQWLRGEEFACNAGDPSLIPGSATERALCARAHTHTHAHTRTHTHAHTQACTHIKAYRIPRMNNGTLAISEE